MSGPADLRALAIAAALLAGVGGCETEFDGSTWQSARIRYHARRNDPLACPDVLVTLERRSDQFASVLQRPASSWEPYDYYKSLDEADYEAIRNAAELCAPDPTTACTQGSEVFSPRPVDEHELAHVYYAALMGEGPEFMEQGFAVALTCASSSYYIAPETTLDGALDPDGPQGIAPAARLVTALWHAGEPRQFFELEAALGTGRPSAATVAAAVSRVYGGDVMAMWTKAKSKEGLECIAHPACDAPLLELGETARLRETCSGWESRRISTAVSATVGIRVAGPSFMAAACDPTATPDPVRRVPIGGPALWSWRFEYWLRLPSTPYALVPWPGMFPLGAESVIEARDIGQAFASACEVSNPTDVVSDRALRIVLPYEAGTYYFPMRFASATTLSISWVDFKGGTYFPRVRWCAACPSDPAANCSEVDALAGTKVQGNTSQVLMLDVESELDEPRLLEVAPAPGAG